MKLVGLNLLSAFCDKHADSRKWLTRWVDIVRRVDWQTSHDIKRLFPSASFLPNNRVIFNVRGNLYRMEVFVAYNAETLFIKWIGTHEEYMKRTH